MAVNFIGLFASATAAAIGAGFGSQLSAKSPEEVGENFRNLPCVKQVLLIVFFGAVCTGVVLYICPPQNVESEALTTTLGLIKQFAINYGAGFIATFVVNSMSKCCTSKKTIPAQLKST